MQNGNLIDNKAPESLDLSNCSRENKFYELLAHFAMMTSKVIQSDFLESIGADYVSRHVTNDIKVTRK